MPATRKLTTRLRKLTDACDALGIGRTTFWAAWHAVFTDPRPTEDRRPRVSRKVYEDELATAVADGKAAVLLFRKLMGRL